MLIPRTQILEFESHLCVRAAAMMAPNPFIPNPSEAPSLLWYGVGAPSCFHGAPSCFNAINAPGQFGDRRSIDGSWPTTRSDPGDTHGAAIAHPSGLSSLVVPLQSAISLLCPFPASLLSAPIFNLVVVSPSLHRCCHRVVVLLIHSPADKVGWQPESGV